MAAVRSVLSAALDAACSRRNVPENPFFLLIKNIYHKLKAMFILYRSQRLLWQRHTNEQQTLAPANGISILLSLLVGYVISFFVPNVP